MPRPRWLTILLILAVPAVSHADDIFDCQPVGEGVVAAIAKPHRPANANAAIILLDDGVMVVDAAATPSSARALIAKVKNLTTKPVTYVVNPHFHWDHFWGNQAFLDEWPGAEIVASESARQDIEQLGLGSLQLQRWREEISALIESWKASFEKETDSVGGEQMRQRIEQWQAALPELKTMKLSLPTLTFTRSLIIRRGRAPWKSCGWEGDTPPATSWSICLRNESSPQGICWPATHPTLPRSLPPSGSA